MITEPKCFTRKCKHFIGVKQDNEDESTERVVCEAYPDGIPDDIAYGDDLHEFIRTDQSNTITFEEVTA